jgi:ATP-dependent Clp protease ATP-binding subunit ClpC
MSVGRMVGNQFWYFGDELTQYHITLRRADRLLDRFQIIGALVFGLGFLVLFIWLVYSQLGFEILFTPAFWLDEARSVQILFWFSIISFSYLVYRGMVMTKLKPFIEYSEKKEKVTEQEARFQTWEEVLKISRRRRIDISAVYTSEARLVLEEAYRLAVEQKHSVVTPIHIFLALLSTVKISNIFIRMGIATQLVTAKAQKLLPAKEAIGTPRITDELHQVLFRAYDGARAEHQEFVQITDLIAATVTQSEKLQDLLYDFDIEKQKLTNVINWVRIREKIRRRYQKLRVAGAKRSKYGLDKAMTAVATPYLNHFSQDLTMAAKFGHLPQCVARDKEIEEIFRIIEGGRQSVILVGGHGVGKMSIIEGITQRMLEEDVPKRLEDKRLVQISTSQLLAGTTISGAQERLIHIMNEVGRAKNVILFINNLHDLVGATDSEGEGVDVSETLAEYLGPGKFLTLATSTLEGYNKHVINTQVGQVFSRVDIKEMDENQAIQVLESKVGSVEYKQRVFFSYDALAKSVEFSARLLHDQRLPESAIEIMTEAGSFTHSQKGENSLVLANDVAAIISQKTGIPTTSITEDDSSKLMRLEEEMHQRVIGQDEAVLLVANALRRARAEIRSQNRPIANFLFLGPTGVGKTELAKTIASVYFGGEERMIRIDMSEYQDQSSIYRLIGQPGQKGTGLLTESVRQKPFSLILLDEMEKADPNVLNLFLQVFDDGRLTDSVGRVIDFTNAIIIATSNAATAYVQEQIQKGVPLEDIRQTLIRGELKQHYRPEFLNRFDGIVLFRALEREEIKQIAGLMLKRVEKDLEERGVGLRVEDAGLEALAQIGFDPEFGARPMRRAIQDRVENKLAELVLGGKLKRRDVVVLGEGAEIRVERA